MLDEWLASQPADRTAPEKCVVRGPGIECAIARQWNTFTIESRDAEGNSRAGQGRDDFFVKIHGSGVRLRAKQEDNGDGTTTVSYKPELSGIYRVTLSLLGEALPGSPFTVSSSTNTPSAPNCVVRGAALHSAVSRSPMTFEVLFRDALGQAAFAEDLDCFVEELEPAAAPESPGLLKLDTGSGGMGHLGATSGLRNFIEASAPHRPRGTSSRPSTAPHIELGRRPKSSTNSRGAAGASTAKSTSSARPVTGERGACCNVVTCNTALVARATAALESERICKLPKGRTMYLLELSHATDGTATRALVAVDSPDAHDQRTDGGIEESWREAFRARPHWLEVADDSSPSRQRVAVSANPLAPRSPRTFSVSSPRHTPIGWVTVAKDGKDMVTWQQQLNAHDRQWHIRTWASRKQIDSNMVSVKNSHMIRTALRNETACDETGVGFAFGGVEPGRLHGHGRVHEVHKVQYSISKVGTYKLHVGLREQMIPLPGSPFELTVVPGEARGVSTVLPAGLSLPLRGPVGSSEQDGGGIELVLHTCDLSGNFCHQGGATVHSRCSLPEVIAKVTDLEDGRYRLTWASSAAGSCEAHIEIGHGKDAEPISGSPILLVFEAAVPDLTRTSVSLGAAAGDAMEVDAGRPAVAQLCLHDQYDNVCGAGVCNHINFGYTLVASGEANGKSKWNRQDVPSEAYKGSWKDGLYLMEFALSTAGSWQMFLWAEDTVTLSPSDPASENQATEDATNSKARSNRVLLTECIHIECKPGAVQATGSIVEGLHSLASEAQPTLPSGATVGAGEPIAIRVTTCDALGNAVAAAEGDVKACITLPDEQQVQLEARLGQQCDFLYTPKLLGKYVAHVTIHGTPLSGSPLTFDVLAGVPDAKMSRMTLPGPPPLFAGVDYQIHLVSVDRYGNECGVGGAQFIAELGSIGLSRQNLPPGQDQRLEVEDFGQGTYAFKLNIKSPCELKVTISLVDGKNISEFAPATLAFTTEQWMAAKQERDARRSTDSGAANQSAGGSVDLGAAMQAVAFAKKLKRRAGANAAHAASTSEQGTSPAPAAAPAAELLEQA